MSLAVGDQLVFGGSTLLLRALGGKEVTKAGRATHKLPGTGELEALRDGFLGLLHGESGRKQRSAADL
jgi:hypothetical protein